MPPGVDTGGSGGGESDFSKCDIPMHKVFNSTKIDAYRTKIELNWYLNRGSWTC